MFISRYPFCEANGFLSIAVCETLSTLSSGCHLERPNDFYSPPHILRDCSQSHIILLLVQINCGLNKSFGLLPFLSRLPKASYVDRWS